MPNSYEARNGLNINSNDAALDTDNDGITNVKEYQIGSMANALDSDGDGMNDGWEYGMFGNFTRTGTGDYDGDGITDLVEYQTYVTYPRDGDANGNGEMNVADQLLMVRHVNGYIILPDSQKARLDLYPPQAPDGQLTIQDLLLLQRSILGLR